VSAQAAYACVIEQTGASVAMTTEATTSLSASAYQITDATKQVIDPDSSLSVIDNGTPLADSAVTIDYVRGIARKNSGSFTGPVTITGRYLPRFQVAEAKSFEINAARDLLDSTVMDSATEYHSRTAGLADFSGTLGQLGDLRTDIGDADPVIPLSDFLAGTRRVISITMPNGVYFRAFAKFADMKESGEVASLVNTTLSWQSCAVAGVDGTGGQAAAWSTDS